MPSERSKNEASLEDPLGMSKARTTRSGGIPPEGRLRAAGLYRTRLVTPTSSTLLYENASGLQLTPSNGAQVLTWISRYELKLG